MRVIIDGSMIASQARYAPEAALQTTDGRQAGVTYIFLRSLGWIFNSLNLYHTQVTVVWDGGRSDYRLKLYEDYKKRPPVPAEEVEMEQLSKLNYVKQCQALNEHFLPALGIRSVRIPGVEADDIASHLSHLFAYSFGEPVIIITDDQDYDQLVTTRVFRYKTDLTRVDLNAVRAKWCATGEDLVMMRAMIGDPSDNIKGVKGIGPKFAVQCAPFFRIENGKLVPVEPATPDTVVPVKKMAMVWDAREIVERNVKLMRLPASLDRELIPIRTEEELHNLYVSPERDLGRFCDLCRRWEFNFTGATLNNL